MSICRPDKWRKGLTETDSIFSNKINTALSGLKDLTELDFLFRCTVNLKIEFHSPDKIVHLTRINTALSGLKGLTGTIFLKILGYKSSSVLAENVKHYVL